MIEQAPIQKLSHAATIGGGTLAASSGVIGWLDVHHNAVSSLGVILGVFIGLCGFGINWYYLHKKSKK